MNEFDFISQLRERVRSRESSDRVITGIGDDAAVLSLPNGRELVITSDLLIEDIDFRRTSAPPRFLGHKALAVSLSDIAAMGARPACSLLSIGVSGDGWNSNFKEEFYEGYLAVADRFGVTLVGGDVSESKEKTVIDSIVLGEVRTGRAILRSTAQPGDQIFVTGTLGGAAAGLKLIELGARVSEPPAVAGRPSGTEPLAVASGSVSDEAQAQSDDDSIQTLLLRQLRPDPRVGWGIILGEEQLASAMIDISDGLSSDLAHLCDESGVGAVIESSSLPIDRNVTKLCGRRALDPLALALHGGEDFELLFTIAPENAERLPKRVDGVQVSHIGEVTRATGTIRIREKNHEWDLEPQGFTHFQR